VSIKVPLLSIVLTKDKCLQTLTIKKKGKGIPATDREGPYGCETLRLPHFLNSRLTDGSEVASLKHRLSSTPQEDSWYSFLSTPGP
jgi:hypothetical protein